MVNPAEHPFHSNLKEFVPSPKESVPQEAGWENEPDPQGRKMAKYVAVANPYPYYKIPPKPQLSVKKMKSSSPFKSTTTLALVPKVRSDSQSSIPRSGNPRLHSCVKGDGTKP